MKFFKMICLGFKCMPLVKIIIVIVVQLILPVASSQGREGNAMYPVVAPPGFCNREEVRYGSIGGLECEVSQSRLYCLCIKVDRRPCNVFVV